LRFITVKQNGTTWPLNAIAHLKKLISKATEHQLPYGIIQCYLPLDTSEHTPP